MQTPLISNIVVDTNNLFGLDNHAYFHDQILERFQEVNMRDMVQTSISTDY